MGDRSRTFLSTDKTEYHCSIATLPPVPPHSLSPSSPYPAPADRRPASRSGNGPRSRNGPHSGNVFVPVTFLVPGTFLEQVLKKKGIFHIPYRGTMIGAALAGGREILRNPLGPGETMDDRLETKVKEGRKEVCGVGGVAGSEERGERGERGGIHEVVCGGGSGERGSEGGIHDVVCAGGQ